MLLLGGFWGAINATLGLGRQRVFPTRTQAGVGGAGAWGLRRRRAENKFRQPPGYSPIVPRDGMSRSGEPLTSTTCVYIWQFPICERY